MKSMKLFCTGIAASCLAGLALVACSPKPTAEPTAPAATAAALKPVASVIDLMALIDPAADLWESVYDLHREGHEERIRAPMPSGRRAPKALTVIEGANRWGGRARVAHPGQKLQRRRG
jgi:hypothetical protein